MVRDTSKETYAYLKKENIISHERRVLLDVLERNEGLGRLLTRGELAVLTKKEKSSVSARINELIKMKLVKEGERRKDAFSGRLGYSLMLIKRKNNGKTRTSNTSTNM